MDLFKKTTLGANLFGEKILCPGAGGAFTPSGSPVGHWSADTITGLEDGDPVATWPDQANSNDLIQGLGIAKPEYKVNIQNSLPVVRFDAGQEYMSSGAFAGLSQPNTIFIVSDYTSGSNGCYFSGTDGSHTHMCWVNTVDLTLQMFAGSWAGTNKNDTETWEILTFLFNGASSHVRLNTSQSDDVHPGAQDITAFRVGASYGPAQFFKDDIAEVIFYSNNETPTDNEAGLKAKWDTP